MVFILAMKWNKISIRGNSNIPSRHNELQSKKLSPPPMRRWGLESPGSWVRYSGPSVGLIALPPTTWNCQDSGISCFTFLYLTELNQIFHLLSGQWYWICLKSGDTFFSQEDRWLNFLCTDWFPLRIFFSWNLLFCRVLLVGLSSCWMPILKAAVILNKTMKNSIIFCGCQVEGG